MLGSSIFNYPTPFFKPTMALNLLYPALTALALLPLPSLSAAGPKVFGLDFVKVKRDAEASTSQFGRRASSVTEALYNAPSLYIANVTIGKWFSEQLVQLSELLKAL